MAEIFSSDGLKICGGWEMAKKIFIPEKYGMVTCPSCNGHGYIQKSKRQRCPECGGFGFIIKESAQNTNISKSLRCAYDTPSD